MILLLLAVSLAVLAVGLVLLKTVKVLEVDRLHVFGG